MGPVPWGLHNRPGQFRHSTYCDAAQPKPQRPECDNSGPNCVEVALINGQVHVRDSKQGSTGPVLQFTTHEWDAFLAGASLGQFDTSDN